MNKILLPIFIALLAPFDTPLQAQSWLDWETAYAYTPESWFWIFPKNIENFQNVHIKNGSNNDWRDSIRLTQSYDALGLPKSLQQSVWYQGQWHVGRGNRYTFDAQNRWTRMVEGTGDSLIPHSIRYNRFDTAGRLQTAVTETYNLFGGGWQLQSMDSNLYAPSGLKTHYYHLKWETMRPSWVVDFKDSLIYDANGRLKEIWTDYPNLNAPYFENRFVLDYTAAGKINFLRLDVPKTLNGVVITPLIWDTSGFMKINYTYNNQNQLIQMIIEGTSITDHSSPIQIRYRFTVDSDGKVLEEIKDKFYIFRPPAWINLTKTIYTYHQTPTKEVIAVPFLTVSPNPVRDGQLQIALQDANATMEWVQLYDWYGRMILNQIIDNQNIINLNLKNINSGSYFLKVKTDKGWVSKKVLCLN